MMDKFFGAGVSIGRTSFALFVVFFPLYLLASFGQDWAFLLAVGAFLSILFSTYGAQTPTNNPNNEVVEL